MRRFWMILCLWLTSCLVSTIWYIGHLSKLSVEDVRQNAQLIQAASADKANQVQQEVYTRWLERELQGLRWELHARRVDTGSPKI